MVHAETASACYTLMADVPRAGSAPADFQGMYSSGGMIATMGCMGKSKSFTAAPKWDPDAGGYGRQLSDLARPDGGKVKQKFGGPPSWEANSFFGSPSSKGSGSTRCSSEGSGGSTRSSNRTPPSKSDARFQTASIKSNASIQSCNPSQVQTQYWSATEGYMLRPGINSSNSSSSLTSMGSTVPSLPKHDHTGRHRTSQWWPSRRPKTLVSSPNFINAAGAWNQTLGEHSSMHSCSSTSQAGSSAGSFRTSSWVK